MLQAGGAAGTWKDRLAEVESRYRDRIEALEKVVSNLGRRLAQMDEALWQYDFKVQEVAAENQRSVHALSVSMTDGLAQAHQLTVQLWNSHERRTTLLEQGIETISRTRFP